MSDALANPGDPVAEVDPVDLKTFWHEIRNLPATHPGQHVSIGFEAKIISKPGANPHAIWYRSMMIRVLNQFFAHEQLAPWIKDEEVSDAVFRAMATIPTG